jgi:hyperosmotically inducible protein
MPGTNLATGQRLLRLRETDVKSLVVLTVAAIALAGCERTDKTAGNPDNTAIADASKPPREAGKAGDTFGSAVTGKPSPGSAQAADAALSAKVKSALAQASDISAGGLEVASANGVVTLYGTVDAPVDKDRAAMLAMEIDGVRSVVNNLVVVKGS